MQCGLQALIHQNPSLLSWSKADFPCTSFAMLVLDILQGSQQKYLWSVGGHWHCVLCLLFACVGMPSTRHQPLYCLPFKADARKQQQ
jgi:hypothetical protein